MSPLLRAAGLALLLPMAGLTGCQSKALPCGNNADCGDGQACIEEECVDVTCLSSADCEIQQYCTEGYTCEAGCDEDTDCAAGQSCDVESHSCNAYGCRDTQLDCAIGEVCDTTTGQCYVADDNLCASTCDYTNPRCDGADSCIPTSFVGACNVQNGNAGCPANSPCLIVEVDEARTCSDWLGFPDNSACPSGWYCDFLSGYPEPMCHRDECVESQCLPSCTSTDDCARGFECVDVYGDGQDVVCYADCEFLNEEGLLP